MALMDPEIARFREELAVRYKPASIGEQRLIFENEHAAIPMAAGCSMEALTAHGVGIERITPPRANRTKAFLYCHGGGHVFGSIRSHRHLVSRLAEAAGVMTFSVEYRLAPEHPFPAGLEDVVNAYRFLLDEGFTPADIVVGGESAGGNLAAALLLKLREEGLSFPAGLYLLSPWLDMTCGGRSYYARSTADPMITREALLACAYAYLAGTWPTNPLVSPVNGYLAGFPSILIQVGTDEVLLSDSLTFAANAALSGVGVELQVRSEMIHAWPLFHFKISAGLRAISDAGTWVRKQLAIEPRPQPSARRKAKT